MHVFYTPILLSTSIKLDKSENISEKYNACAVQPAKDIKSGRLDISTPHLDLRRESGHSLVHSYLSVHSCILLTIMGKVCRSIRRGLRRVGINRLITDLLLHRGRLWHSVWARL